MTNQSITVTAVSAELEKDIELIGKQDPYLRASLQIEGEYQKTFTDENAGKHPKWQQSFTFPLNGEPDLFVEIMDEEKGVDAIIAYTAIPIRQVVEAENAAINGQFALFDHKGNIAGQVNLIIQAHGFHRSSDIKPETIVDGQSYLSEEQQKRARKLHRAEQATDVAAASALAAGVFFLGKSIYDKRKEKNGEEEQE